MFNLYDGTDDRVRLYLEIMRRADDVGDHDLRDLVFQKLLDMGAALPPLRGPGKLLAFPGCAAPFDPPGEPVPCWPSQKATVLESLYLLMVLGLGALFCYPVIDCWVKAL